MSVLSTAIYAKNLPVWERFARLTLSTAAVILGLTLAAPWSWVVAVSAASFALTGLFGFCPACAMIGRRPLNQAANESRQRAQDRG